MVLSPDKDGQRLDNVGASRLKIKERATRERKTRREQFTAEFCPDPTLPLWVSHPRI